MYISMLSQQEYHLPGKITLSVLEQQGAFRSYKPDLFCLGDGLLFSSLKKY
jgi:hypothetical protein